MPFREDILRGVRLFAIAFAAILVCVAAYRIVRLQSAPVTASEAEPPAAEPAATEATPVPETASDVRPAVVPEPPPVGRRRKVVDPGVPPPPPIGGVARAHKAASATGTEVDSAEAPPSIPVEETSTAKAPAPKQPTVGYKSLIEATATRPPDPTAVPIEDAPVDTTPKGNRFIRALGRFFHPGGKKEATPLTLQPKP